MLDDVPDELFLQIISFYFQSNPTLVQLARIRRLCVRAWNSIDSYIEELLRSRDVVTLRRLGMGSRALSTLQFANPSWSTYMYTSSKRCCLCGQSFNGQIRCIGVFAHDDCIKRKCVSVTYLCRPFSHQAMDRLPSGILHALRMRAPLSETLTTTSLPTITWSSFSTYFGPFEYTQVFAGPTVPMLTRAQTLLGWLYDTDDELHRVIAGARKWQEHQIRMLHEEEEKRQVVKEALQSRRREASAKRTLKLQKWLQKEELKIEAFFGCEPFVSFCAETLHTVAFSKVKLAAKYVPKVEELLQEYGVGIDFLPARLPTNDDELLDVKEHICKRLQKIREKEEKARLLEEENKARKARERANRQFKTMKYLLNSFLQSDNREFHFLPMNNYCRMKIHEHCAKLGLLSESVHGEGVSRVRVRKV